jgi:predicted metal-dependent peptidase
MSTTTSDLPRSTDYAIATAKIKLSRALGVLVRTHPFHGYIAAGWRARPDSTVGTMGVCWACGGVQLLWNPEFVNRISDQEVAGVLLHEVMHVALRHMWLFPDRAAMPPDFDAYAALVAEEISVNEYVSLPLPGSPYRLEEFVEQNPNCGLVAYESTRDRYRKIYDAARARRHYKERKKLRQSIEEHLVNILDGNIDNHAGWGTFRDAGATAQLSVAVATAQSLARHGQTLSRDLRDLILGANKLAGTAAGGTLESLAGTAQARLSWQRILRRLLAVDQDRDATFLRPPRRFPDMVGVLPGSRRAEKKLKILAAIDTSGSMSADTLDEIAAELRVMARSYEVSVVEFDCEIQRMYRLQAAEPCKSTVAGSLETGGDALTAMQGRGGTSFFPVFQPETLAWAADGSDLSGVVVFTDGFGRAPAEPPAEPVIWVLIGDTPLRHVPTSGGNGRTSGGFSRVRRPAAWGTVVDASAD